MSVAFMLAELSMTSTIRRVCRFSPVRNGSDNAPTSKNNRTNCTNSETRCRNRCQMERGFFCSKICRQNRIVETGTRRRRIFRM
jgi:hypothetical protein